MKCSCGALRALRSDATSPADSSASDPGSNESKTLPLNGIGRVMSRSPAQICVSLVQGLPAGSSDIAGDRLT
jgi:hypothetical protein